MGLTVNDINGINSSKEKTKNETFVRIIEEIDSKIYKKVVLNESQIFIQVPQFVVGEPLYDWKELIKFTVKSLKSRGFWVQYIADGQIYISWSDKDTKKETPREKKVNLSLEDFAAQY